MKLHQLSTEVALFEIRAQVGTLLSESISDYLATTLAQLKNDKQVDLDKLAEILSGLKILGKADYRESLTKDDLGINPNSFKELFQLLNSITKDVKDMPKMTAEVFTSLKSIAPSIFKKTRAELEILEKGTKSAKQQQIQQMQAFATKVNQMFYKLKHGTSMPADKKTTDIVNAADDVGSASL